MQDTLEKKLLETMRRISPAQVVAYNGDDDARVLAVPKRRRRWDAVMTTIAGIPWSRLEFLDGKGALLGVFDNTAVPEGIEELAPSPARDVTSKDVQLTRTLLDEMLRAQRQVLEFRDAETKALLQGVGTVLQEVTSAMQSLATIYRDQVKAAADVAALRTEATVRAEAGDDSLKQLLEAAPALAQLVPLVKGLLSSGTPPAKPAAPPNGATK